MKHLSIIILAALCISCGQQAVSEELDITPTPSSVKVYEGKLDIYGASARLTGTLDDDSRGIINAFMERLAEATEADCESCDCGGCVIIDYRQNKNLPAEGYAIKVGKTGVTVEAAGAQGFSAAINAIKQLLPQEIYAGMNPDADWTLPYMKISDK